MRPAIVAIPARDEADRIGFCLAALAMQRDQVGAPLPAPAMNIVVYANNCSDETATVARHWSTLSPFSIEVVEERTPPAQASAGLARKRAMDLAAAHLDRIGRSDGVILTTDADSCVASTWAATTMQAFAHGVDAVAGYIDAHPVELVGLGPVFLGRGRLEDRYLRAIAEIDCLCDPRPHNPWPTHRVSSGASLAVTLAAYRAIGGLPPVPVGEDAALTAVLDGEGFKVRHAMDVVVSTSCRFDGRAQGGAADTMRERHRDPDAPCDADLAPARDMARRAFARGRLRRAQATGQSLDRAWLARLGLGPNPAARLIAMLPHEALEQCWRRLLADSPVMHQRPTLRPSDLPGEIAHAERLLVRLRRWRQRRDSRSSL